MPFGLSAVAVKAIGIGLLVLAVLAGMAWLDHHVEAAGAAKFQAAQAAIALKATQDAQAESARREADQQTNLREANNANTQHALDGRDLDGAVQRVRDVAASQRTAASHSGTPAGSQAASVPGADMVPRGLYQAALDALAATASDARDLARSYECKRTAGQLCADDYQSLTAARP